MKITVIQKLENTALSLEILSSRILLLAHQPPSLRASPVEVGACPLPGTSWSAERAFAGLTFRRGGPRPSACPRG